MKECKSCGDWSAFPFGRCDPCFQHWVEQERAEFQRELELEIVMEEAMAASTPCPL